MRVWGWVDALSVGMSSVMVPVASHWPVSVWMLSSVSGNLCRSLDHDVVVTTPGWTAIVVPAVEMWLSAMLRESWWVVCGRLWLCVTVCVVCVLGNVRGCCGLCCVGVGGAFFCLCVWV